jgi:hypothetical protein
MYTHQEIKFKYKNVFTSGNRFHCPNVDTSALPNVPFVPIFMRRNVVSLGASKIVLFMIVYVLNNRT